MYESGSNFLVNQQTSCGAYERFEFVSESEFANGATYSTGYVRDTSTQTGGKGTGSITSAGAGSTSGSGSHTTTVQTGSTTNGQSGVSKCNCEVRGYNYPKFAGANHVFETGDLSDDWSQRAESLKLTGDCNVVVYAGTGYTGKSAALTKSVSDLDTIGLADEIQSIKIANCPGSGSTNNGGASLLQTNRNGKGMFLSKNSHQ
jgi:hypothetical protein